VFDGGIQHFVRSALSVYSSFRVPDASALIS
jgi:hypothetical protein